MHGYQAYRHVIDKWEDRVIEDDLLSRPLLSPLVPLLRDSKLDTLALGQRYPGLSTLTNDEDVRDTGSECPIEGVFDVNDVETTDVLLLVYDNTNPSHVTTTSNHDEVASIKFDEVNDFVLLEVELHSVVDLDEGVRVTDSSAVVGDDMRNTTSSNSNTANFEELVGGLLRSNAMDSESALDVVEESEMFTGFLNGDDIHVSSRVGLISANLSVDFDEALLHDGGNFTASKSILQPVTKEDGEGKGFAELVGTW